MTAPGRGRDGPSLTGRDIPTRGPPDTQSPPSPPRRKHLARWCTYTMIICCINDNVRTTRAPGNLVHRSPLAAGAVATITHILYIHSVPPRFTRSDMSSVLIEIIQLCFFYSLSHFTSVKKIGMSV